MADLTGDGRADIVGFGDAGVYVALSNGDGSFAFTPVPAIADFGAVAGGWRVDKHPRLLADMTGDGRADIVGFGDAGVYVALSNGDGSFALHPARPDRRLRIRGQGGRWTSTLGSSADVTGDGRADIVGFGDAGVLVGVNNGNGTFRQRALFVIPNFGLREIPVRLSNRDRSCRIRTSASCRPRVDTAAPCSTSAATTCAGCGSGPTEWPAGSSSSRAEARVRHADFSSTRTCRA